MLELTKDYNILSERCNETELQNYVYLKKVLNNMEEAMTGYNLNFLTANQLGIRERVLMLRMGDKIEYFINPMLTYYSKEAYLSREKDYSNDKEYLIVRNDSIEITFQNKNGTIKKLAFKKPLSALIQSLIDLLDGVLQQDSGLEILPEFDEATEEEQKEVINMYLESLKNRNSQIQEEIKNDEHLAKLNDEINHMTEILMEEDKREAINVNPNRKQRRFNEKIINQLKKIQSVKEENDKLEEEQKSEEEKTDEAN